MGSEEKAEIRKNASIRVNVDIAINELNEVLEKKLNKK